MLHREAPCLVEPIALFGLEHAQLLDRSNLGIARINFAQAIAVGTFFFGLTVLLGATGQTGEGFRLIGIHQQNLAPVRIHRRVVVAGVAPAALGAL